MNIHGTKTRLRAMEPEDMELLRTMMNDPAIEAVVGGWSYPVSRAQQLRWYDTTVNDAHTKRWIVETTDTPETRAIGMVYITDVDWKNRSLCVGIKLASDAPRRRGYATDALTATFRYCFDELQMHRLSCKILRDNLASVRLFEKCGMKREGILRESIYKNGRYQDQFCYAILDSDFYA